VEYRPLGTTGLRISVISFGCGPVPALLTKSGQEERQQETIRRAVEAGVNWFDTAATYGDGQSELSLGAALAAIGAAGRVHVATKVRLQSSSSESIGEQVRASVAGSLARLRLPGVDVLQVHNSITPARGELPTSITPRDVLGPGGMLEAFEHLRRDGLVGHFGLTGLGDTAALAEVIGSGAFATIQLPFNLLSAAEQPECPVLAACRAHGVAVLAIRVLAGGALAGRPPSDYTKVTKFFPLELYERNRRQAAVLQARLGPGQSLPEAAVRFVLGQPGVVSALIGFSDATQLNEAVRHAASGPLAEETRRRLLAPAVA
jgi:aryl-alcohol dehydrogenase-like predicted oxidoreductase